MAKSVVLSVPAEADFARTVRMVASNLAVVMDLGVDEVEDVRMAAEEGFVYACSTAPKVCDVAFELAADELSMCFGLGSEDTEDDANLDFALLLLDAVCDEYGITEDGSTLRLVKKVGVHAN